MADPDVPKVAETFRGLLIAIAVQLVWTLLVLFVLRDSSLAGTPTLLLSLLIAVVVAVFVVRTGAAMGYSGPVIVLMVIGLCIPLISLLVLLRINASATRVLRENGYEVGLLGPRTRP